MKYNKKCIAISAILFMLFTRIVFGIPPLFPIWLIDYYAGAIYIIFLAIFLFAVKYCYGKKCLTVFLATFISLFILTMIVLTIQEESKLKKQGFFYQLDQIVENPNLENNIGLGLANLFPEDEKEIKDIIKKAFEGQWNYYYDKDENKLNESIEGLYISKEYLLFKEEIAEALKYNQEQYEYINFTKEDVPDFVKKIEFSKFRKYENLNDRIGVIAGFSGSNRFSMQYFLFKKTNDKWRIEKERMATTSPYELPAAEIQVIEKILEEQN